MMLVTHRLARRCAQRTDPETHFPTQREEATRKRILAMGQGLMAEHGPWRVTWPGMAQAMGHTTATLRKYFVDQDVLLVAILDQHLAHIAKCFATVPRDAPRREAALRAAYLGVTRTGYGALTEAHHLLVHDRHRLPPDELAPIEDALRQIADIVAGAFAAQILPLLDSPAYPAPLIETLVAALHQAAIPEHRPQPATPPEPQAEPARTGPPPKQAAPARPRPHDRPGAAACPHPSPGARASGTPQDQPQAEGWPRPSLMDRFWAEQAARAGPPDTS